MTHTRRAGGVACTVAVSAAALFLAMGLLATATPAGAAPNCPAVQLPCQIGWTSTFSELAPVYGTGDFDGDGADDLLVLQDGTLALWYGGRTQVPRVVPLADIDVERGAEMQQDLAGTEPVVADVDGDGRADILWSSTLGAPVDNGQVWFGTATPGRFVGGPAAGTAHDAGATWYAGDFDADGGADVVWYDQATGGLQLQLLAGVGAGVQALAYPDQLTAGRRLLHADLDGNRAEDLLFYDAATGQGAVWFFEGGGAISARPIEPGPGFRPAVGDVDGDGLHDVVWYGPGEQLDAYWFGTSDRAFRGAPMAPVGGSAVPVVADLDGDGRDDVLWWEPNARPDVLWLTRDDGPYPLAGELAAATQVSMPDFDGDGAVDLLFTGVHDAEDRPTYWAVWWLSSRPVAA